jgi:hypothetical protein
VRALDAARRITTHLGGVALHWRFGLALRWALTPLWR